MAHNWRVAHPARVKQNLQAGFPIPASFAGVGIFGGSCNIISLPEPAFQT